MHRLYVAAVLIQLSGAAIACTKNADCDWKCFIPQGLQGGTCAFSPEHLKELQAADLRHRQRQDGLRIQAAREAALRERTVELQRNPAGHYVAEGRINGTPVVFIVDTGATDVAISLPLARRLGLPLRPGGVSQTANGLVATWTTQLDSVDLGGLVVRNVPSSVLPKLPEDGVLLGMSYLQQLELTQRGDTLTLKLHP